MLTAVRPLSAPQQRTSEPIATFEAPPADGVLIRWPQPTAVVLEMGAEVTSASERDLQRAFELCLAGSAEVVALDFRRMEYLNSGGVGQLATLIVRAARSGRRLVAFGLSELHREIFALTRLDEAISVHETEGAALAGAGAVR